LNFKQYKSNYKFVLPGAVQITLYVIAHIIFIFRTCSSFSYRQWQFCYSIPIDLNKRMFGSTVLTPNNSAKAAPDNFTGNYSDVFYYS